jgi:hypothetical protein
MKKIISALSLIFISWATLNAQSPSSSTLNLTSSLAPFFLFVVLSMSGLYLFVLFLVKKNTKGKWIYVLTVLAMLAGLYLTYQLQQTEAAQLPISAQDNNISLDGNNPKPKNGDLHSEFYVTNMSNIIIFLLTVVIDWKRRREEVID